MAPAATKRKRTERNNQNQGSERPSPHRPQDLSLAQQSQSTGGGRGGRRASRGGNRGSSQPQQQSPSVSSATAQRSAAGGLSSPTTKPPIPSDPSSKADPPPPISNPNSQALPSSTSVSNTPYFYQFVTDERTSKWQKSGRAELVSEALERVQIGDVLSLNIIFQELTRAVLSGRLRPGDAGAAVKEILDESKSTASRLPSNFLDCVSCVVESGLPDATSIRDFLISTGVSPSLMREQLEASILVSLNLVRSTFVQMGTRYSTSVLYKQTTYNLLREDTEGFSKLITEYFSTAENNPPSSEVTSDTFQKVKALIGTFNLDPGRTLDVTLDVFANLLVKQYKFFIKFLRGSSFWPQERTVDGVEREDPGFTSLPRWAAPDYTSWNTSESDKQLLEGLKEQRDIKFWNRVREVGIQAFFELGGRRVIINEEHDQSNGSDQDADQEWISATGTYPPQGNKIAAQLLGFKLRFYASEHRDKTDVLPENIIFLAALLIHIGFISLRDLYPHLYPPDETMPVVEQKLMKEKAEREEKKRPGGGQNALTKAGALIDDTIPQPRIREPVQRVDLTIDKSTAPSKPDDSEEPELPEPENQKIVLLRSLLLIGAIPEALFILGRFPWLIDACPELPEHIFRLLHHSLSKVYAPLRPLFDRESTRQPKPVVGEQAGLPKGHLKTSSPSNRKTLRWAKLDSYDPAKVSDYRYYFDEWSDNVPICQSVDDIFSLCSSFLSLVGVRIGQDAELLSKLARIGRQSLADDTSEANLTRWQDLCKRILVPALSLTKGNTGVVSEIWELLKTFSIQTRFSIYAEWYGGPTSRQPEIKVAFDLTRSETKDVLKRISKTNARTMARALGKVADTSPGIVYAVTLNQIESYNNLIDVVVDGARYFTSLGFDVLTWSIMNSLGGGSRNRVQADGMLTSPWLRALSVFAGNTFRHYKMMNPSPILRYIADQLRKGNSTDLEILEQIITSMAGIRSDTKYGEEAVQALSGGPLLRDLTLRQLHDRRHESRSQTRRLLRALSESNLAGQLLVLIAQERQLYIFRESASDAPLKVLGNNLDKIHDAFVQYLDMLRSNLSVEEFNAVVPSIARLIEDFGLDASLAFTICRPSIRALIDGDSQKSDSATNGDTQMQDASTKGPVAHTNGKPEVQADTSNNASNPDKITEVEMVDAPATGDDSGNQPSHAVSHPWHPVLESLMQDLKPVLPIDFEETMSLSFYVRFWQLDLHDMFVPSYETETKRLQERLSAVNADRSDVSRDGVKRKEAEKKRLSELVDGIRGEMKTHIASYQVVRKKLAKEKDHWFTHFPISKNQALTEALIQECFFPRMILSPQDAHFTAKYVFFVHHIGTPGFRTLHFFDHLLREKQILATLFQCTAREAENFGRFLNDSLKELRRWSLDKTVYDKMAHGVKKDLPGCASKLNPDQTPKVFRDYEDFRRLLYKWHRQLHGAVKDCLTSGEYMHIRNAIILIKAVHKQWPEINYQGDQTIAAITELSKNDPRDDLKLSAQSLMGDLTKRKKQWVPTQAFMLMPSELAKGPSRSTSARPVTPQPVSKASRPLDPKVPEFKSVKESNGPSNPAPSRGEVEDGEIEDAKKAETAASKPESSTAEQAKKPDPAPTTSSGSREEPLPLAPETKSQPQPDRQPPNGTSQSVVSTVRSDARRPTSSRLPPPPTQHALPNRPEGEIPRERISHHTGGDRNPDRLGYRHGPEPAPGRLDRPGDIPRDTVRPRHDIPGQRSRNLTPERMPPIDRRDLGREAPRELLREQPRDVRDQYDRPNRPPPRETYFEQPPRDRGYDLSHGSDARSRPQLPASAAAPPARSDLVRDPPMNPERAARFGQPSSSMTPEHSDRDRDSTRRNDIDRLDRATRSNRNSRQPSPRHGEELPPVGPTRLDSPRYDRREERGTQQERPPTSDYHQMPRDRPESTGFTPSGPRSDRPGRHDQNETANRPRELIQSTQNRVSNNDFALPPRPTPQQDPNYGRLNPMNEVPSGPRNVRGQMGRGARNFSAQPSFSGPNQVPASPSSERQPSAPSQDWRERRISAPDQANSRVPSTAISVNEQAPAAAEAAGIHPSRANRIQEKPLQVEIPNAPVSQAGTQASPSYPPSGPRSASLRHSSGNFAQGSSPTTRNPPSGPSSASGGRDTRHMANLNSHLQQAANSTFDRNDRTLRVRGKAFSSGGNSAQPISPVIPQPPMTRTDRQENQLALQPPPPPPPPSRVDAVRNMTHPERAGGSQSGQDEGGRSSRRQDSADRRSRHRGSRSRSPRREREDIRQRDEVRPRDELRQPGREERQPLPTQDGYREREQRKQQGTGSDRDGGRERRLRGSGRGDRQADGHKDRESRGREPRGGDGSRGPPPPPPGQYPDGQNQGRRGQMNPNEQWDPRGQMQGPPHRGMAPSDIRNGEREMRSRGGHGERKDDSRRESRDGRKRGRVGGEESVGMDVEPKRARRGQ